MRRDAFNVDYVATGAGVFGGACNDARNDVKDRTLGECRELSVQAEDECETEQT